VEVGSESATPLGRATGASSMCDASLRLCCVVVCCWCCCDSSEAVGCDLGRDRQTRAVKIGCECGSASIRKRDRQFI
jgi:hypothetical protein